jgi:hypothetical protein
MNELDQLPAILGGPQSVTCDGAEANRWPEITIEEENAVLKVLRDGDLSLHPVTRELEDDYRQYFGVRQALARMEPPACWLPSLRLT